MQNESVVTPALKMVTSGDDILTGGFILAFGPNDLLFGLVFGYGAWKSFQEGVGRNKKAI